MKKIIYLAFVICILAACSNEEEILTNSINYENGFAIVDDPNDPMQHERYLIYKNYGVPVYFNDTISAKEIGKDWYGNSIIRYETIDLNWSFTGYDHGVDYKYVYLAQDKQMSALKFVRKYLDICSKPMYPFSIMVADTLRIISEKEIKKPVYKAGFRTLVFAQLGEMTDDDVESTVNDVIRVMVRDKIAANQNLCAKFKAISDEKKYYGTEWPKLGGCPVTIEWMLNKKDFLNITIRRLFYGEPYIPSSYLGAKRLDFVDYVVPKYVKTKEEANEIRNLILREIGTYGFITDGMGSKYTPTDADNDRNDFISAILYLGKDGFTERYGASPLVMKKYTILSEYIIGELGIQL